MEYRDFHSVAYKNWRVKVFKRDFFSCRMCGNQTGIQAHHIRRWADCVELRFVVANGITLCKVCHDLVKDREDEYASRFTKLVGMKPLIKTKKDRDTFLEIRMRLGKKK